MRNWTRTHGFDWAATIDVRKDKIVENLYGSLLAVRLQDSVAPCNEFEGSNSWMAYFRRHDGTVNKCQEYLQFWCSLVASLFNSTILTS